MNNTLVNTKFLISEIIEKKWIQFEEPLVFCGGTGYQKRLESNIFWKRALLIFKF